MDHQSELLLVVVLDAVSAVDGVNHSNFREKAHFVVAETVEERAALAQDSHSLVEPCHIAVVPYRIHPDTQVDTVALRSASLVGSSVEKLHAVALIALGGFASAALALVLQVFVASMAAVEVIAAVEQFVVGSLSQSARLEAAMR